MREVVEELRATLSERVEILLGFSVLRRFSVGLLDLLEDEVEPAALEDRELLLVLDLQHLAAPELHFITIEERAEIERFSHDCDPP
jgi:hypothetical protein